MPFAGVLRRRTGRGAVILASALPPNLAPLHEQKVIDCRTGEWIAYDVGKQYRKQDAGAVIVKATLARWRAPGGFLRKTYIRTCVLSVGHAS